MKPTRLEAEAARPMTPEEMAALHGEGARAMTPEQLAAQLTAMGIAADPRFILERPEPEAEPKTSSFPTPDGVEELIWYALTPQQREGRLLVRGLENARRIEEEWKARQKADGGDE